MARNPSILVTYTAVIVPAVEGGYNAHVPALNGCGSQGKTLRDVRANIRDAAEGWIESALARREDRPVDNGAGHAARRRGARVIRIRVVARAPLVAQETIGRGHSGDDD